MNIIPKSRLSLEVSIRVALFTLFAVATGLGGGACTPVAVEVAVPMVSEPENVPEPFASPDETFSDATDVKAPSGIPFLRSELIFRRIESSRLVLSRYFQEGLLVSFTRRVYSLDGKKEISYFRAEVPVSVYATLLSPPLEMLPTASYDSSAGESRIPSPEVSVQWEKSDGTGWHRGKKMPLPSSPLGVYANALKSSAQFLAPKFLESHRVTFQLTIRREGTEGKEGSRVWGATFRGAEESVSYRFQYTNTEPVDFEALDEYEENGEEAQDEEPTERTASLSLAQFQQLLAAKLREGFLSLDSVYTAGNSTDMARIEFTAKGAYPRGETIFKRIVINGIPDPIPADQPWSSLVAFLLDYGK